MATTAELLILVNNGFRAQLHDLSAEQLNSATPCDGWTARDCLNHVVGIYHSMVHLLDENLSDDDGATALDRFNLVAAALEDAVMNEALAGTIVESPFGPLPLKQLVSSVVLSDTLVHTWDLAVATGGDRTLDPVLVERAYAKMEPMDEHLRSPGMFGPKIAPPSGADRQTEFLCFLGRDAGSL